MKLKGNEGYFSIKETTVLKCLFAILVILSHLRYHISFVYNNAILMNAFNYLGHISVGGFFFISGYGLYYSFINKPNYLKGFLRNRFLTIYLRDVALIVLYSIILLCFGEFDWKLFIKSFFIGGTVIIYGWYIQAIIVFYICFWLIFILKIKNEIKILIFTAFAFIYIALCMILNLGWYWYQSILCLPLGMLWCNYYNNISRIVKFLGNYFVNIVVFLTVIAAVVLSVYFDFSPITNLLFVTAVSTILVLSLINSGIIKFIIVRPIIFIGSLSFEIYALHGAFIKIFRGAFLWIDNTLLFVASVLISTILTAFLLNLLFKFLDSKTRKSAEVSNEEKTS